MKSFEELVSSQSEYFVYTPSKTAREMFFYPLQCGHFIYEAGYTLRRESYDSFLLLYVYQGTLVLEYGGEITGITAGQFLLLDCYRLHAYSCPASCDCLWCHFDGVLARHWYSAIVARLGNSFSMPSPCVGLEKLQDIYSTFASASPIREPLLSKYLADLLTSFLLYTPLERNRPENANISEKIITYVNEHFKEAISVKDLADLAGLSQFHFIRTFKKETGYTPHEYIIHTRIGMAKYLLKNTRMSVKDICFQTGFSCESVFCSSFKHCLGMTPAQYRVLEDKPVP